MKLYQVRSDAYETYTISEAWFSRKDKACIEGRDCARKGYSAEVYAIDLGTINVERAIRMLEHEGFALKSELIAEYEPKETPDIHYYA